MTTDPTTPARPATSGLVIAGFVLSIVGLLLSFIGGGFIPGIVALVLLGIGARRGRTPLFTAGVVLSVIAIVLSIVIGIARVSSGMA